MSKKADPVASKLEPWIHARERRTTPPRSALCDSRIWFDVVPSRLQHARVVPGARA